MAKGFVFFLNLFYGVSTTKGAQCLVEEVVPLHPFYPHNIPYNISVGFTSRIESRCTDKSNMFG